MDQSPLLNLLRVFCADRLFTLEAVLNLVIEVDSELFFFLTALFELFYVDGTF